MSVPAAVGVAVAAKIDGRTVEWARLAMSGVGSRPVEATAAGDFLAGKELTAEVIQQAADLAAHPAKPLDNTDLTHFWRKRMVRVLVEQALSKIAD